MDHITKVDYEFEGFRLDSNLQVLICPTGDSVSLPSRAFATLRYLVERSGEIVEKSALMNEVWPTTVVAENNLNQCILTLRKVLGESAGDRHFILTVPGRGYKFVAPVRVVPHEPRHPHSVIPPVISPTPPAPPEIPEQVPATRPILWTSNAKRWRWLVVSVGACIVLALSASYWFLRVKFHAVASPSEYQPLTDVVDSATAPILSPDGRMLAFIRNGGWLLGSGQIWVRALPDGEYVRLTDASGPIFAPTFTSDGTRIAYTVVDNSMRAWDTWTVPVTGGEPTKLLPNASGLTYVGPHEVMFSEFKTGIHLGIVTAKQDRSDYRDVYWPAHERAMAHFSYLSPNRSSVLVVEMDGAGQIQRCRLVPFGGGSSGVPVGPIGAACFSAAWSTDGAWMYFSAYLAGHSHLWRQRFPDGEPQQITFGPTDEETVFAAPDGRSLLTSIGTRHNTLWFHHADGERALTTEGNSDVPWLSTDTRRVYFLSANNSDGDLALSRMDLSTGSHETLLSEFNIQEYDVTPDEQWVVFTTARDGVSQIWLAPLDRHAPPRLLVRGGDQPKLGGGKVFFRSLGQMANHLHSMNLDGSNDTEILSTPILNFFSLATDARSVTLDTPIDGGLVAAWLISLEGRGRHLIGKGWFPSRLSRDGKALYVEIGPAAAPTPSGRTAVVNLNADGMPVDPILPVAPETKVIPQEPEALALAGSDPTTYVYVKSDLRRNIYRIPLH
jgi:DNA-binding winged helix-turn-helix (wHTH) protein/Tol biopolymer transport system component